MQILNTLSKIFVTASTDLSRGCLVTNISSLPSSMWTRSIRGRAWTLHTMCYILLVFFVCMIKRILKIYISINFVYMPLTLCWQQDNLIHCHHCDNQHPWAERLEGSENEGEKYVNCQQGGNKPCWIRQCILYSFKSPGWGHSERTPHLHLGKIICCNNGCPEI